MERDVSVGGLSKGGEGLLSLLFMLGSRLNPVDSTETNLSYSSDVFRLFMNPVSLRLGVTPWCPSFWSLLLLDLFLKLMKV